MRLLVLDGMVGEPLPYLLRSDWMITGILFLCMIAVSYILSRGRKYICQQLKTFTSSRERNSLFDDTSASDIRYTLALVVLTCVLAGFCIYGYFIDTFPLFFQHVSHMLILGILIGFAIIFLIAKWSVYKLVNRIFFSKSRNMLWANAYFNIIAWVGLLLFPVVLLITYFDLSVHNALYWIGFIVIFAKFLLFCKCFSNFFSNIRGAFHLILYFCALEILPDLVAWKGIISISNNLILNN